MLEPNTVLDQIPPHDHWTKPITNINERIIAEAELLSSLQKKEDLDPELKRETLHGVEIGAHPRKNVRMTIHLTPAAQKEWGCEQIVSDTIYAKNNPIGIKNAVTSSSSRYADTITLLRSSLGDCYAGRVDTLAKAQEMAQFVFLGEIDQFKQGTSKGIVQRKDGVFELTFAVQSLLNMIHFDDKAYKSELLNMLVFEGKLYKEEKAAYEELLRTSSQTPLQITHPITGKTYQVIVKQVPIAATPCNWIKHVEKWTSDSINGRAEALKESAEANQRIEEIAKEKIAALHKKNDFQTIAYIEDSLAILKNSKLKPWQEILTRAYLLHLLGIPEAIHCKSSCDRTGGFVIPLVFAMQQWLRAKRPIPKVNGRYCIYEIVRNESVKELIAAKLQQEAKTAEYSRGEKGLKVNETGVPNPAYQDILPERYLERGFNILMTGLNLKAPEILDRKLIYQSKSGGFAK